ncbi:MAG: DegV family protein [Oscillospiraceae bacterium]
MDSRNLSTGQGHVVLEACRLAKTATDPEEMYRQLNAFAPTVDASFLLDRLDYMVKGGRCSSVVALGANLLRLKPCIEVVDNKMIVGKSTRQLCRAWSTMSATVWRTATTCCTTRSSSRTRPSRRRSSTP